MNKKGTGYKIIRGMLYSLYLFIVVFILLEIGLQIYNPFHLRIKGNKLLLPINKQIIIKNDLNPRLDSLIVNTRNSIGLRGAEPPVNMDSMLSIITVGGSTTECYFLNDDSTWTARLGKLLSENFNNVWINNAGLSGHSTFGNQILLNNHLIKLKPKIILFLLGTNDIENDGPSFHDKLYTKGAYPSFVHYLYNNSEVVNIAVNMARGFRAQKFNNTTDELKSPRPGNDLIMDSAARTDRISMQNPYLQQYRKRIEMLADTCVANGVLPVFITQPWLYGEGVDSVTHVNLATYNIGDGLNGELFWSILQMYHDQTRKMCREKNIPMIDLAKTMPKNSIYYYDATHYTNEGARMISRLINNDLQKIIRLNFQL